MTEIEFTLTDTAKKELINVKNKIFNPNINIGSMILSSYNNWYSVKGKLYYFKYENVFEELLMREVANDLGLECVDFKLAICSDFGVIGIISENFRTYLKDYYFYSSYFWNLCENVPENMIELADFIKSDEKYKNLTTLFLLIALDIFSGQYDRGDFNIVIETFNSVPFLSPLTDNGCILKSIQCKDYSSSFGKIVLYSNGDNITDEHERTFSILSYIKELFDGLVKCLDIDIESYIDCICKKYGLIISEKVRHYIVNYFDIKKKYIDNTLSMVKR